METHYDARHIARYLLTLADEEAGDLISNLKLQKLLYYAQGLHLAIFNKPLFDQEILAWTHGPVVEDVWREYHKYEAGGIPRPTDFSTDMFDETKEFLNEIYKAFGQYSAWKLRTMTHQEPPWKNTPKNQVITQESLKAYFETQLES